MSCMALVDRETNPCNAESRGEGKLPRERAQYLPPLLDPVRHSDVYEPVESPGTKQSLEFMIKGRKSVNYRLFT